MINYYILVLFTLSMTFSIDEMKNEKPDILGNVLCSITAPVCLGVIAAAYVTKDKK